MSGYTWPDLGEILRKRKELGVTQRALAEVSGVPQPLISRVEKGRISDPSYSSVRRLFVALGDIETRHSRKHEGGEEQHYAAVDLMNKKVISVEPSDWVKDAWEIMKKKNFTQLPVIDDMGRIVGGIAESSLPLALEGESMERTQDIRVEDVMGDPFPIVGKNIRISIVASLLQKESAVLVIDKGKVAGIITKYDVLEKAFSKTANIFK